MNLNIPENTSKNTHNIVESLLLEDKNSKKVLDIPSGAGAFTYRLIRKKIEVHSADIENIMQIDNPHFMDADMNQALPYKDSFFDAIVCIDGIEHIERDRKSTRLNSSHVKISYAVFCLKLKMTFI